MLEFDELRIRIRPIGIHRYLVLANGPAYAAAVVDIGDEPALLRKEFAELIGIEFGHEPSGGTNMPARMRELGRRVFTLVLNDELRACLDVARTACGDNGLRLRFDLPAGLQEIPLEALCSPADLPDRTFAFDSTLSVTRSLPRQVDCAHRLPKAADGPDFIHLLVAIASPAGHPRIEAAAELAELDALPDMTVQKTVLEHATRHEIVSWVEEHSGQPAAVLLIAHGSLDEAGREGVVLLESDDGTADHVTSDILSGILTRAQRLRLVVLNLCSGACSVSVEPFSGVAQALIGRGIPAVAGMHGLVTDHAASKFAPRLLDEIRQNKMVDQAMTTARREIAHLRGHTAIEWATPVLFLHHGAGHGWLFKAREVRDDEDSAADPLQAGAEALERIMSAGNVSRATVLAAARYLRTRREWNRVVRTLQTGSRQTEDQIRLITEAKIELAWPALEQVCDKLHSQSPETARELLDTTGELLPKELFRELCEEISQTRTLCELADQARQAQDREDWPGAIEGFEAVLSQRPAGFGDVAAQLAVVRREAELSACYTEAEQHRAAQRWQDALAVYTTILNAFPDYRDASAWAGYVRGRIAEIDQDWEAAAATYHSGGEFEDCPGRLAYARGRCAAAAGDWALAHREFLAASTLGLTADEWLGYAEGRQAEARGDWPVASEAFAQLGGFRDSGMRSLFAAGQLAAANEEWAVAVQSYEAVSEAGEDVSSLLEHAQAKLYEHALAAEAAHNWPEASKCYGLLPVDHEDAAARWTFAEARAAEETGNWQLAAERYEVAEHPDAAIRAQYARGRLAEQADEWEQAYEYYVALPGQLLDAGARTYYAAGRCADAREDWAGVIEGFGALPDDFADGDVGLRRRFARAKLAARRSDWRSVLALLGEDPDAQRGGLVGLARQEARGRLAEDEGDWAVAVTMYARGAESSTRLGHAHRYAIGRLSELDGEFAAALDSYAALPSGYRDVADRGNYARARLLEQDSDDWSQIIAAYAALPDDFGDVRTRSAYARLRLAIAQQDWETALGFAEVLGEYRDAAGMISYARGRSAEQAANWDAAISAYRGCAGYADAASRQAYAAGRRLEDAGHWSAAIAEYEAMPQPVDGSDQRRHRLACLLAEIPWADGLASASLTADPVAWREQTFPYRALRPAGVTPASSTQDVADATYTLMERGGISGQERVAWDQLRTPAKRLQLDTRLYQFRDPVAVSRELNGLNPGEGSSLLAQLCARLPADAALLTLLAGNRAEAMTAWRRQLSDDPGEIAVVHCLAVASLWQAQELEDTGAWEQAQPVWRTSLACWTVLLTDDDYWAGWRQARAACYGHAVTPADSAKLRVNVGRYLIELLSGHAQRHASAGRPNQQECYRELVSLLETELAAAQALKETGGLPLEGSRTLACGPVYLRMCGLTAEFGEFVARVDSSAGEDTKPSGVLLRRLRWSFSELSTAFSFMEQHRFEAALRALPAIHRQPMAELPEDCAGHADGHRDECQRCDDFLARNPAYACLPKRQKRLLQDAVGLAVRAHLSIARGLLTSSSHIDQAMAELAEAVAVSANAAMTARTRDAVLRMILGRVDALTSSTSLNIDRLEEAVALMEKALPLAGKAGETKLNHRRADLLVDCGVWYGSACHEWRIQPDIRRAVELLRAAFALNPDSARVRDNLARALIYGREKLPGGNTVTGGLASLRDALVILHDGLISAPASSALRESLFELLDDLETVLLATLDLAALRKLMKTYGDDDTPALDSRERARALAEEGERLRASGDPIGGLHILIQAVRLGADSAEIRALLIAGLTGELDRRNGKEST